jgi:di/tricarboxylate transporter
MGLPISSFPNANAAGKSCLLTVSDFITTGFPLTVGIWITIISFGYCYGLAIGL